MHLEAIWRILLLERMKKQWEIFFTHYSRVRNKYIHFCPQRKFWGKFIYHWTQPIHVDDGSGYVYGQLLNSIKMNRFIGG
jgi:hypothetical protein